VDKCPKGNSSAGQADMTESKDRELLQKAAYGKSPGEIWSTLSTAIILSFYFLYFLLRIDPKLIYQSQEPVFFFDRHSIYEFFSYPGALNDLASKFLSQFFYYSWTGALLLVLVLGFVTLFTWLFIRSITTVRPALYLHWIPSIILLALHSEYRFPLALTLGLLWALVCVNIYIHLAPSRKTLRFLLYLILQATLYYVVAGQVFIFSLVIVLYEVLHNRSIILPSLYILLSALLPYLGATILFIINMRDAYVMHLTSYDTYRVTWLSWVLYAFFPFVLILFIFEQRYVEAGARSANKGWGRLLRRRSVLVRPIQAVVLLSLIAVSARYSYNKEEKAFFLIDHYSRFEEWQKVLDVARKGLPINNIVQCQVNRALYHAGYLSDEMFRVPQLFGSDGLFLDESIRGAYALQHSDFFFDLGLINESEHWAHEAIAANGNTAWNLQRLVLVNLLKEKPDIAKKYLVMLGKTMWHRNWASKYQKYLSDSNDFWAQPKFRYLESVMPKTDFLVSPTEPKLCLAELIKNANNKMAFEYFMTCCLLDGQISRFMQHLYLLNSFAYPKIPRHFEEAMLIYNQLTGSKGISLPGKTISEQTIQRFADFNRIMARYNKDKKAARGELSKYRDTYWFYGLYYYKPDE
jgi:hypothetical protein